jgi:hypothetical protein
MNRLKVCSWFLLFMLTCFFVLSVGLFSKALAAPIFSDDFESYAQGTFPGAGGWVIIHNGAGDAQQYVDTSQAASGTQSFHTMGSNCWAASLSKSLTIPNRVRLEAKVFVDQVVTCGCTELQAQVGLWRSDDTMWAGAVIFGCDGNLYASTQSGFPLVLLTSYSVGGWHDVRVDYDYTSKTFDVFIDGVLRGHAIPILDDLTNKMPNAVRVGAVHGNNPIAWFDDVKVSELQCTQPPSDLVAWWPGDNSAIDITGNNNGTLVNDATFAPGMVGQAFSFDGVDDHVNVGNLSLPVTFTIDAWIKPVATVDLQWILAKDNPGASQRSYFFYLDNAGVLGLFVRNGSGQDTFYETSSAAAIVGQWSHVAVVYDGNAAAGQKMKFYVNGQSMAAPYVLGDAGGTPETNSVDTLIGKHPVYPSFNGIIDEVEIFNRVLSQTEIMAIYNAGSAGKCRSCVQPPSGMVSWWKGENNANDSADNNHGTVHGATFAAGKVGQAISFDGVDNYVEIPDSLSLNSGSAFTVDGWFYIDPNSPENSGDLSPFVAKSSSGSAEGGWWLIFDDRDWTGDGTFVKSIRFSVMNGTPGQHNQATAPNLIPSAGWYHIAGVYDQSATPKAKLYLNGALAAQSIETYTYLPNAIAMRIGAMHDREYYGGTQNWKLKGLADEVEFFNRALSAEEIAAIYAAGSAGKCPFTTIYVSKDDHCGGNKPCFLHIQYGIAPASIPATIKITGETYIEDILLDFSREVTLEGGWDENFASDSSYTTIDGSLTIKHGTMIIEKIILK